MRKTEIDVEIAMETKDAFLVDNGDTEAWVPKSLIDNEGECTLNKELSITIPEWLAIEKGLV